MIIEDAPLKAMRLLLEATADPDQLRNICWDLAREVAATRKEEKRLWAIIHAMQAQHTKDQADKIFKEQA